MGPTGPTGPAGSSSPAGLAAYAGLYHTAEQTIPLNSGTPTAIALPTTMPNRNLTYGPANQMTIVQAGDYEINYFLTGTLDQNALVTLNVRVNGDGILSAATSHDVLPNQTFTLSGNTYVNLQPGIVIDMTVTSSREANLELNSGVNASLTLKKLN